MILLIEFLLYISVSSKSSDSDQSTTSKRPAESSTEETEAKKSRKATRIQLYKPPAWKDRGEKKGEFNLGNYN